MSRDLLFEFWDLLHISGMGAARDFKFDVPIDRRPKKQEMEKCVKGGVGYVT